MNTPTTSTTEEPMSFFAAVVRERNTACKERDEARAALAKSWSRTCIHHTDEDRLTAQCPVCATRERDEAQAKCAAAQRACAAWKRFSNSVIGNGPNGGEYVTLEDLQLAFEAMEATESDCGKDWHSPEGWAAMQVKCEELKNAITRLKPFAIAYTSHPKRNPEDKLQESLATAEHALSTDCGKDFVPRAELDAEQFIARGLREQVRSLTDERDNLREQVNPLVEALGLSAPWNAMDILSTLADWCDHLSHVHDCDCCGHEVRSGAVRAAREMVEKLQQALARAKELGFLT